MPLRVDEAEVHILYHDVDKIKTLNKNIKSCLGRINSSAQAIQDGLSAIERDTRESQTILGNIEGINKAIGRMQALQTLASCKKSQAVNGEDRQGWI